MKKHRIVTWLLTACVLLSCSMGTPCLADREKQATDNSAAENANLISTVSTGVPEGFVLYAQSNGATLYLHETDCVVAVDDGKGNFWRSTPDAIEEEEFETGSIRMEMRSLLSVEFVNDTNSRFQANCRTSSINRNTFQIQKLDNGFVITFDFSRDNEKFKIPLKCTLESGKLVFEVLAEDIDEYGTSRLLNIRVVPYFGASGVQEAENGFVFVPDGSGAVIDFCDDRGWAESYREMVYGGDAAHTDYPYTRNQVSIHLPVFGMSLGNRGFTGIIEQGAAFCCIEAIQPGYQTRFASVGVDYVYRQIDSRRLKDNDGKERLIYYQARYLADVNPRVSYTFMQEECDLADMAKVYRDYLTNTCGVVPKVTAPRLTVELIGETSKKASFLGFVVDQPVVATSFEDASSILQRLQGSGVDSLDCILYYFTGHGTDSSVPKSLKFSKNVGNKSQLQALREQAGDHTRLYYQTEFVNINRSSFGWWPWNSTATSVLRTKMNQYRFQQSTNTLDYTVRLSYFLMPVRLKKAVEAFARRLELQKNEGILLSSMGSTVYSDYGKRTPSGRENTAGIFQGALDAVGQKTSNVAVDGANAYVLGHSGKISNVPVLSSNQECLSRSVPFYSMALHGLVDMSGSPLNGAGNSRQALLEFLTGVTPTYRMTGESAHVFQNTRLDFMYNTYCEDWLEQAASTYKQFAAVHDTLKECRIIDYEQLDDLHIATYDNGTSIAVNLAEKDISWNGKTVPAGSYAITTVAA